jgi:UDP-glucose 6-dehydrogenase
MEDHVHRVTRLGGRRSVIVRIGITCGAIQDFKRPDRIVVGTVDDRARRVMAELNRPLYLNRAPMLYTTVELSG